MEAPQLRGEHRFRYVARGVSLVIACMMCLGVFVVPLRVTGSEVPSALAMANLPLPDLETNENAPPLDGIYVVALGEEAEDAAAHALLRVERGMAVQEHSEAGSIMLLGFRWCIVWHRL